MANKPYDWKYVSLGGVTRVQITSGEDIAHLGELDQKKWTVLSCPVGGLEFDGKTLSMIDTDADGKIRVGEMVAAAEWLTSVLKDRDAILKGEDTIPLDQINTGCEAGKKLYDSARQILSNLGLEKDSISVADTSDSVAIFAKTKLNGDGIVTPASTDDEALKKTIETIVGTVGSKTDRSGEPGVDADLVEQFYAALADYAAWLDAAEADLDAVRPYGDDTSAALDAVNAVKDKVADYFMRCKLINFDEAVSDALDVSVEKVSAISGTDLVANEAEIATYPLARPEKESVLPLKALNPAWQAAFGTLKTLVLDKDFPEGKDTLTEAEWKAILAKFAPYTSWMDAKKGSEVEPLGGECIRALLAAGQKEALLALIAEDKALEEEAAGIDAVDKLTHLYRDFYRLLRNYVNFSEYYSRDGKPTAIFEAGKLYIDERCCNFCVRVEDMGQHGDMAGLSNMFLIYCTCTQKATGKTMNVVAAMTAGDTDDLRPGKNALFYDRNGLDWDAVVTKVVENPISIKKAFWSPYRKLAKFVSDKIDKNAAEKDSAAVAKLQTNADAGVPAAPAAGKQPFDIAKFAGIFAAIGMAVGALGVALAALFRGIFALKWWQLLLVIAAIMLIISGPACFIAWRKLRRRNLGPVLNANGWAVNSKVLVNILFGKTLTSVAKYPIVKGGDPFVKKTPLWRKILRWLIALLIVAFGCLYFTDQLGCIGLPRHKAQVEEVAAAPEAAAEAAAESAPEAAEAPAE
ncbi:MAG: phage holin family protein [Bacteroidales bacterium]|nr:phage holin family protein [Bacteroidales bacterium]